MAKGEAADAFRNASMFLPFVITETHEIIPCEKSKEIVRAIVKAQIAAMTKPSSTQTNSLLVYVP